MNKKSKILLGVLLFVAIAALRLPMSQVEAESSSASDFQMKGDTLVKYTGTASAASIPVSVKHIGKEAFSGHAELKKVEIPGYVESIDYNAFSGCSSLENVVIPDTVTAIGNGAFSGCSSLKIVTIGKKLDTLGNGVFADCAALSEIKLSKNNTDFVYDSGVIYSKDKTIVYAMIPGYAQGAYKMPSTVKEIKSNAFWGCMNLEKVEIGSNVKKIPDYAFANCQKLGKVLFPYSVTTIGIGAFSDCINLGSIEIPLSVSSIHETAFEGCPKLVIIAPEGSYAAEYESKRDKSQVAQSEYQEVTKASGESGSEGGQGGTDNADADTGTTLGQSRIVGGNAVVFIDNSRSKVLSGNVQTEDKQGSTASSEVMGGGQTAGAYSKYTIVNDKKIAAQAYYGNTALTEYEIPETVEEIGDFAFARTGLTIVTIPDGVITIGYGAFYHADDLASVSIPDTVTTIEPSAFDKTKWMENCLVNRRNPFTVVGDGILIAYGGVGDKVEVPEGVKQIGAEVFKGHTEITVVTLPSTCTVVGEDAFAGCNKLTSISGGDNLKEIKDRAFSGCPISTIKIPSSVEKIGLKAYDITGTTKEGGSKVAVFLGKSIPGVSYEKTATRLINEEDRGSVLKGVNVAIVNDSVTPENVRGTALDYDTGGFRGLVCSVEQAAEDGKQGRLRLKFIVMREEDVNDNTIPSQVTVYGKSYKISNPREVVEYVSGSKAEVLGQGMVSVEVDSATLSGTLAATAQLSGINENYVLKISDNAGAGSTISAAYKKAVPGGKIVSLQVYDFTLYDAKTMIPISKAGKQQMTVTIPKPMGVAQDALQIACLDEDGQLEKIDFHLVTVDGVSCIQFNVQRFTTYAFFN